MTSILVPTALATATLALLATGAVAGDAMHSGSWTAQITKQEVQPLGSKDHLLVAQVAHGTNKSTGSESIADGGQVMFSETIDLDRGNGPQHGLFSVVDGKGSTTSAYEGKVTTIMVDGKPHTTGAGAWHYVWGSGAYVGVTGTGTYSFAMTSPTDLMGEWSENTKKAER